MRAALYIRVSTDDQAEYSPSAQRKALIDYAKHNSMDISEEYIFIDEGKSGKTAEKRPEFMRMIGLAKNKPRMFDVILVHKFDRFSRNREDSIVYKAMLNKECGIKVISITESLNEDDKMSVLIEALLEAMAEYYSINLAQEVKKGMTEKALRGGYQTTAPFGYKMENGILVPIPEESELVVYIYQQFLINKSPLKIARALNQMGIKTKHGNNFDANNIKYILQNPVYIGKTRWTPTGRKQRNFNHPDTIVANGEHKPIITEEMFNDVANQLAENTKKHVQKSRPLDECSHWLSGLVKCSNCGGSLTKSRESFQCYRYEKGKCSISHSITIKKLEKALMNELNSALENMADYIFEKNIIRIDDNQEEIILLKKQIDKLDEKYQRAKSAYLEKIDTIEEYRSNKLMLENQKQSLILEIEKLDDNQPKIKQEVICQRISNLTDLLKSDIDMEIKQKAIRSLIQKIIYSKTDKSLEVYYYNI